GYAVLLAVSRKDFVGEAIGDVPPQDRLHGTIAATALAVERGAAMIRTHDVRATADAIAVTLAITGEAAPKHTVRRLRSADRTIACAKMNPCLCGLCSVSRRRSSFSCSSSRPPSTSSPPRPPTRPKSVGTVCPKDSPERILRP